jgi:hypothetical protein
MHEQHPNFDAPSDPDISIWRYMNLAKFVSMLQGDALYFACPDRMTDEFEGSLSESNKIARRALLEAAGVENFEIISDFIGQAGKDFRSYIYLNCWHMNPHESAAMWDIYLGGEPQGIALRSTYRRLTESITDPRAVFIGTVNYVDFNTERIPDANALHRYLYKRKSFEHERELRALHLGHEDKGENVPAAPLGVVGVPIAVDLDGLIEAVYVSPKAPEWFAEVVRDLLKRYGRNWSVAPSSLDGRPIY